uniref:Putative ferric-chelate reductase 1 n=1 Tax=Labrus bergylta TaxID=56723 RepID=A0A3Q3GPR4_9LABR
MEHVVLLLVLVAPVVYCYSSGLVMDSCKDMRPHHSGVSPQTDPAPFNVTTDNNKYTLGEVVTVTLQATASIPFIGFLLQAREVGGWSPVGSFILTDESTQQLTCNQKLNYRTFWVDVKSPALTFRKDSTGGSTTFVFLQKNISSKDCGVTKVCFSQPSNCDPTVTADCYFMSARALSPSDVAVHYEITGPSDGYIAIGFSDDRMMGNDDIYICVIGSNGLVQLQHAFSTGRKAPQIVPLGNVSDVSASVQGRVISCSFTSMNILSTLRTTGSNKTYHILFAHGPSNNVSKFSSLMLIAWMTMGSVGMMVARYRHGYAKGKKLWGKDIWFVVHVAVMSLTVATTVIAFILPFSFIKAWSGGAHPVLGCLVMILSFVQITLALLRCGPGHPKRFLFNWTHALNGLGIRALSVAGVFTGLKLIDSSLDQWLMKVMGGFVGWEVLFFILLFVNFKWKVPRKGKFTFCIFIIKKIK